MNEARGFADRFRQIGSERDDVVIGSLLNLVNAGHRKFGATLDLFQRLSRDYAHLPMHFAHGDLNVEPFLKLGLFRPESAHFRQCVAVNHGQILFIDCQV